jgi:type I restriction enzyme S subunit
MTIEEIADVNPRVDKAAIPDDLPVSFVPMPAVGAGDGSIRVEETRPAGEVKKGFTAFLEGDVLFAKITPCMENGKMAVVPKLVNGYGFGSTEFHVLRPKPGMDAKYIYYYVSSQAFRSDAERYMTGAVGQKRVSTTYLKQSTIPVAPLDQQKRIVAEIEKQFSRLDEAVANLKRVKANLKRYKTAVLKAAVEGRLVETEAERARREGRSYETGAQLLQRILETRRSQWQGKGKYKEPAAPDITGLPELPEGWVWVSWEMILESTDAAFKRGPFGSALTKAIFVEKGFKVYEQYCPINDDCSFARYYITPEKFEELRAFEVQAGDYLISCSGVTLGRITRVPKKFERGIINQALLRVRINEAFINGQYFLHLFRSALFQKSIFDNSSGSAIPNVKGVKELKAMAIPLPNLAEQKRIVAEIDRRLSLVREVEAQVDANLKRAERLHQSILARAFSGGFQSEIEADEHELPRKAAI